MRVNLGAVAKESRETISGNKNGLPVVGLEHLITGEISLTAWDVDCENTFTKVFRKGQILFGRRRAYLKKAVVAPFDGICSGDITLIEALPDKLLPELLPFIIQNDTFFDYAVGKSAGSLSPRVKWERLRDFEFELPTLLEQRKLADLLWAANSTRESYKKVISAADELVKSRFVEMFGSAQIKQQGWEQIPVSEVFYKPMSGEWGTEDIDGTGVKVLRTTNFTDEGYINYADVVTRLISDKKCQAKALKRNDIIIEKSGGSDTKPVGRVVLVRTQQENLLFNNFTSVLRIIDSSVFDSLFVFQFLYNTYWNGGTKLYDNKTTGIHNLRLLDYLENTFIPIPPIDLQNAFADFVRQADKSKFELQHTLEELETTYKSILRENLG